MITAKLLLALQPKVFNVDRIAEALNDAASQAGIKTPRQVAMWLANLGVESRFIPLEENLNYGAQRLMEVWPSRFPTKASTVAYTRNPIALGNKVYGGRADLGNTELNDGYRFRGRGFIQITGRSNYGHFAPPGVDLISKPDQALQPEIAAHIAASFWIERGCNTMAERDELTNVRKKINGGVNGLEECRALYQKALSLLE